MFRIALAVVALRILDDNFLQPAARTSPADHLVSGLVPLALFGVAAYAYPRLAGFWQGALSLLLGLGGIAVGIDAVYYTRESACPPTTSPASSRSAPGWRCSDSAR